MTSSLNPDREFLLRHIGFDKKIVRSDGMWLEDTHGVRYLDFLSQYGALPFGHNPQRIWDRLKEVADQKCPGMVQPFFNPQAERLAERLLELLPWNLTHVTLTNSGAESVEAAMKMARAATGRDVIVSLDSGFHGKTYGALCATGNPVYSQPFMVRSSSFRKIPEGDLDVAAEVLRTGKVAAVILEPVLGEGGMRALNHEYIRNVTRLCRETGTLLIIDEIQTGLGRTGDLCAIAQVDGVEPDIICLAKALGGGVVPIGAVVSGERAWTEAFGIYHSSTFANNGPAAAVAMEVLDILTEDGGAMLLHAREQGRRLEAVLENVVTTYPDVFSERTGTGLMHGLRVCPQRGDESYFLAHASYRGYFAPLICGHLLNEHHVLTAPLFHRQDIIRLEPPLIVCEDETNTMANALMETADHIRHRRYSTIFSYIMDKRPEEIAYSEEAPTSPRLLEVDPPMVPADEPRLGSFAFLIHPTTTGDLIDIMPESIGRLHPEHQESMLKWMESWFARHHEPAPVFHAPAIRSKRGGIVEGWLIACPLTPQKMLRLRKQERATLLAQYMEVARELGVGIVGLGAFTSVISRGGSELLDHGIPVTTGNSFTAIASAESLHAALKTREGRPGDMLVAVVGATGSVGRLAAIHLSEKYCRMALIGNPSNPRSVEALAEIAGEIYAHALWRLQKGAQSGLSRYLRSRIRDLFPVINDCNRELIGNANPNYKLIRDRVEGSLDGVPPIEITIDLNVVLPRAHGVLSATSHGQAFIPPGLLRRGAVVCDAARPPDLTENVTAARPDVLVFEGGVVRLVEPYTFGRANILGFDSTVNLACLSETIALAMNGTDRSYSIGKRIPYDEAFRVYKIAQSHGFTECIATTRGECALNTHGEL